MLTVRARRGARVLGLALTALAVAVPAATARPRHAQHHHKHKVVNVQLLAINDFHGQLEALDPAVTSSGRVGTTPAGGAEYLATHVRELERGHPNSLVVAAGDIIGASPLTSALFHDEPTIEAMNKIGLDLTSVGNHEFDEGEQELKRMQYGGCHPVDGCRDGTGFGGAKFGFLAANVVDKRTGRPMFAPYAIRRFRGVKVGFIGMTLEGTPLIVTPSGIQNLDFLDEADTANRYARELRRRHGVKAIVVLLHEGGQQNPTSSPINDCVDLSGPVRDIVNRTTDAVDLFITGHTHQPYNCVIDGRPVTSAFSLGRVVTDLDLKISRRSRDVTQVAANNLIVTRDVPKAPDMTTLIARYSELAAPFANRVIGRSTAPILRATEPDGESAAGNLIADSQLAATSTPATGGAVAAFMNIGGVRADFPGGDITYGAAFSVQPFGNNLTTLTLTGAQVWTLLGQQWCNQSQPRILQPSASVRYTWDATRVAGACTTNPVTALTIGGTAVPNDAGTSYRITVNSFLADGGDGFAVLPQGTARVGGPVDLDALEAYLAPTRSGPPIAPPALDRVTRVG
jgi:5'-nucleotidase